MKAKLLDARPLMNVCGRFGFVPDLTHYHVNPRKAPLVVVQLCDDECPEDFIKAAKEYPQPLGVDACIRLFEQFKSYEGSYFFLGTYLSSRSYPLPCMPTICFDILKDMAKKANPGNAPLVVVQLLDDECPEDFVKVLLYLSVLSFQRILLWSNAAKEYPQPLGVDACIRLFEQFKSYEGLYFFLGGYLSSRLDPDIHFKHTEGVAKTGQINYVERVTRESKFYDPEKKKNLLMKAMLPDARPLINVCGRFGFVPDLTHYDILPTAMYTNNMLRYIEGYGQKVNPGNAPLVVVQLLDDECPEDFIKGLTLSVRSLLPEDLLLEQYEGRYVVERMDPELWEKVLSPDNEFRRQLIDQVVSTSLPESKSPEQVSAAVKEYVVWSQVAKVQLCEGLVSDAIESFIRKQRMQLSSWIDIWASEDANVYHDLVRLDDIKEFILMPNVASLPNVGDRLC
ncbi:hypothetical protein H6P81_021454 [Aristolochia fimbriata]|uniref:Uncharacterized protein n=1 Tax=Aristolochia fimbriata TaxID=158543 RepID=A0AAV7DPW2_ARIFI|nr:hypothetical protein H6P81_021454 [Aristolochia fimbriata]